jgi:hypothetical protein
VPDQRGAVGNINAFFSSSHLGIVLSTSQDDLKFEQVND